MDLILYLFFAIYLTFYLTNGFFLDPKDENPNVTIKAEGSIQVLVNYYYLSSEECSVPDAFGDNTPYSSIFRIVMCAVKKGCDKDFGQKVNKTEQCKRDYVTTNTLITSLSGDFAKCIFKDIEAGGVPGIFTYNQSGSANVNGFYQTIYTLYQFIFTVTNIVYQSFCYLDYSNFPIQNTPILVKTEKLIETLNCLVNIQFKATYKCSQYYVGTNCLYKCIPDNKRKCLPNDIYNIENCMPGWVTVPVTVYISNNNNCGYLYKKTEIIHRCMVLDKCSAVVNKTTCIDGYYCVPVVNNTAICAKYMHFYESSFYPEIINFTRVNILKNEIIIIKVNETSLTKISFPIYRTSWKHYTKVTDLTPLIEDRNRKNSELIIINNKLTITPRSPGFGFDYMIYAVVSTIGQQKDANFLIDFTIIKLPSKLKVRNLIYVYYNELLDLTTDGWPNQYMKLIINRTDISFIRVMPIIMQFIFPAWRAKLFNMLLTVNFNTRDGININISTKSYHSTRAFDYFYWNDSPYILMENDVLSCFYNNGTNIEVVIRQIAGISEIDDVQDSSITLQKYEPGEYILECRITIIYSGESFRRFKMFEIHEYPKRLCIMPFAPAIGQLLKCECIVYPPGGDDYSMVLVDLLSQSVIVSSKSNYLRIPYIIIQDKVYQVTCTYRDQYNGSMINLQSKVQFHLDSHSEVTAINYIRQCMEFGTLPDEYAIKESNSSEIYIFYNQLFYLKSNAFVEYNCFSLILAIIFNYTMLYIIISGSTKDGKQRLQAIYLQTESQFRHNFMRRINNKISNITSREIDASKKLFESFHQKHLSIDENDSN